MNTTVTLSARALLAGLLALLVVVGAYLLGQAGTQEAVAAPVAGGARRPRRTSPGARSRAPSP